jgi:hypothetical protein
MAQFFAHENYAAVDRRLPNEEDPHMESNNRLLAAAIGLALTIAMTPAAQASPITYSFSVTTTSGPLGALTASGTFTYDTSSIVPGGTNLHTGLLTDLAFIWNGIAYDETTANTGSLSFNGAGTLTGDVFGNTCGASTGCLLTAGQEQWRFESSGFVYSVQGVGGFFSGTVTQSLAAVPAPKPSSLASLALLGVAVAGLTLAGLQRRQRHSSHDWVERAASPGWLSPRCRALDRESVRCG